MGESPAIEPIDPTRLTEPTRPIDPAVPTPARAAEASPEPALAMTSEDSRGQTRRSRRRLASRRSRLVVAAIAGALVIAIASIGVAVASAGVPVAAPAATSSPSPKISPRSSPTAAPTPAPIACAFTGGTLSVPSVGIAGPITEYTAAQAVADGGVNPAEMDTIAWYSGITDGIPTVASTNTTYIYGHSWTQPAIFNDVRLMTPGATVVVQNNCGETVTYLMTEPVFTILKPELSTDPRITQATPGRLLLISCFRPDGYDPNSPTVENVVAVLQRVAPTA